MGPISKTWRFYSLENKAKIHISTEAAVRLPLMTPNQLLNPIPFPKYF